VQVGSPIEPAVFNKVNAVACRGCHASKVGHLFVHIAPAPKFSLLGALNHRVFGGGKVGSGMFVWAAVAATNVAAGRAHAQMHPMAAHGHTFCTHHTGRCMGGGIYSEVFAGFCHMSSVKMQNIGAKAAGEMK